MEERKGCVRVRVAPSPTGPPHVGTAYIALFNYAFARSQGGQFILRIEDTDRERSSSQSERAILEALRWLGLHWDEGPDIGGACGPYRQSERFELYRTYAQQLLERGDAYRCFCTPERLANLRRAQQAQRLSPGYDGLCRALSLQEVQEKLRAGLPYTIRLKVPTEGETRYQDLVRGTISFRNAEIDDQILLKSDGFPTYHLANVVDDHLMGITHVCRAEEWITSTPKHVLLYKAFGWQMPVFIHMPLLRNKDKSKISKRKNPVSLTWYKEQGYLPEAILNFLGLMGWSMSDGREVFSLQEMIEEFAWDRVKTSGPVFDLQKLEWLNGYYIRNLTTQELLERLLEGGYTSRLAEPADRLLAITRLVQERLKRLAEFDELTGFFFEREPYEADDLLPKKRDGAFARQVLLAARALLQGLEDWRAEPIEVAVRDMCESQGWRRGDAYMPLRVAVTCRRVSTPLFETMEILGKQECLARLEIAIQKAQEQD